jgi:hypothetical protein
VALPVGAADVVPDGDLVDGDLVDGLADGDPVVRGGADAEVALVLGLLVAGDVVRVVAVPVAVVVVPSVAATFGVWVVEPVATPAASRMPATVSVGTVRATATRRPIRSRMIRFPLRWFGSFGANSVEVDRCRGLDRRIDSSPSNRPTVAMRMWPERPRHVLR